MVSLQDSFPRAAFPVISKQISFSAGYSIFPIRAQLGTPDTCQCLARIIIVDLCVLARLGCAGGHQTSARSPSVFAIRRGVCTSPPDAGNTFRGGDKNACVCVHAPDREQQKGGEHAFTWRWAVLKPQCSRPSASPRLTRVTESCQKKGWGFQSM